MSARDAVATTAYTEYVHAAPRELHPLLSLIAACFSVIFWLLTWIKSAVAFITISIPRLIYAVLSYSFTLTLHFYTLVLLFLCSVVALSVYVRRRYLSMYKSLRELPLDKPTAQELHPDVNKNEEPAAFHNYLDEFLQAVRVFGFLEKPVFHELARHLQTRRLITGDSIALDADKSFYCVVDGNVQIFAPPSGSAGEAIGEDWDDGMSGYQLLNEVGSGGTVSSLFTILSLFTEDVQLRWTEDEPLTGTTVIRSPVSERLSGRERAGSSPSLDLDRTSMRSSPSGPHRSESIISDGSSLSSTGSTVLAHEYQGPLPVDPPAQDWDTSGWSPPSVSQPTTPSTHPHNFNSISRNGSFPRGPRATVSHPVQRGTVVRAVNDTTLAVIPAEAFGRLTKKFPKASAHIVQVILTRFFRVTFQTAHRYLGLTSELLRTEKSINDIACHPLPRSFYQGGGVETLRQRFQRDGTGGSDDETGTSDDYLSHDQGTRKGPSSSPRRSRGLPRRMPSELSISSNTTVGRRSTEVPRVPISANIPEIPAEEAAGSGQASSQPSSSTPRAHSPITPFKPTLSRLAANAGDLHTAGDVSSTLHPLTRKLSVLATPKIGNSSRHGLNMTSSKSSGGLREAARMSTEDFDLRDEVMSCIAKSIGLMQPPLSGGGTAADREASLSPTQYPLERPGGRTAAMFNASFSSLLAATDDGTSSITGGSSNAASGRDSMSGLDNEVEILCFTAGSSLVKAGEKNAGLYYVIDGLLDVSMPTEGSGVGEEPDRKPWAGKYRTNPQEKKKPPVKHLFTVSPGGIAGYLASLSGIASYVDIRAKTDVYVGLLPAHALERLLEKRPIVLLTLAKRLISLLSPLVLHIDSGLDWTQLNAGQVLWRPNDESDSVYIVINGRLRALIDQDNGEVSIVGEYGQGDTIGELDVITNSPRQTTVHAIRDTELARMPMTLFNAISMRNPQSTVQLLRRIASRVRDEVGDPSSMSSGVLPSPRSLNPRTHTSNMGTNNLNLKTVAILPSSKTVPVGAFAKRLQAALEDVGAPTHYLNQGAVMRHLGKHAFSRMGKLKVAGWLADLEQRYRIVLYVADSPVSSPWTQTCIRQADCVMVVGKADDSSVGEYERLLLSIKTTARKELVLLHPERSVPRGTTRRWLKTRPWVHAHFHIELPGLEISKPAPALHDPAAVVALKNLKDKVQTELQKYRSSRTRPRSRRHTHDSDFARLARHLCGKTVGLILGGGGARGFSHVGFIRAMEEHGVPIDHIGGTSIGALVGGLYAQEGDIISGAARAKQFGTRMSTFWRLATDLTWPVVAYTTGHEFNRSVYKAFWGSHIEDMWLPYFCNTTNILESRMEVHETGYAWRYIRASMSLVGLVPPLSDNGRVLVDGGYVDNLPVSTMMRLGASTVFAVDVGSLDDNTPRDFGDTVSGWWMLLNQYNPFSRARNIPSIAEIQSRLAYVSSVRTLEEAKVTNGCLYFAPPVQEFGTLQFGKFEDIVEKGYKAGIEALRRWKEEGKLPTVAPEGVERGKRKGRGLRRNSI